MRHRAIAVALVAALERWPEFFIEDCRYRIISAENYDSGMPLGLIYATSKNMLHDRVSALREANIYEPQRYRHIVSGLRIAGERDGALDVRRHRTSPGRGAARWCAGSRRPPASR